MSLLDPISLFMPGSNNVGVVDADTAPSRLWDGKSMKQKRSELDPVVSIPADLLMRIPTEQLCASDRPTSNAAWWKRNSPDIDSTIENDNVSNWLARLSFVSPMNTKKS